MGEMKSIIFGIVGGLILFSATQLVGVSFMASFLFSAVGYLLGRFVGMWK